jgi:hypothetical protein
MQTNRSSPPQRNSTFALNRPAICTSFARPLTDAFSSRRLHASKLTPLFELEHPNEPAKSPILTLHSLSPHHKSDGIGHFRFTTIRSVRSTLQTFSFASFQRRATLLPSRREAERDAESAVDAKNTCSSSSLDRLIFCGQITKLKKSVFEPAVERQSSVWGGFRARAWECNVFRTQLSNARLVFLLL